MSVPSDGSLSERTIRAGIWTILARVTSRGIDFIVLLVLARLLGPDDFGLVATAMTVIYIVEAVLELPLTIVLVRLPEVSDEIYNTAFTLGLIRGLLVAAIMVSLALPFASLYEDPRLAKLMCVLSLAPAARGLSSPRMVIYDRAMDFSRKGLLEIIGKSLAAIVAISVAFAADNYWAVATGTISNPLFMLIFSYVFAPMWPNFSLKQWRIFSNIAAWNFVSQVISAVNWQIDRLILPIYVNTVWFGRFTTANDLASLPYQAIMAPISAPIFAALVNARNRDNFQKAYLTVSCGILMLMAPVMCFIGMMADPIIKLILGSEWYGAIPILTAVSLLNVVYLPTIALAPLVMALDRPRLIAMRAAIELAIRLPLTILAIMFYGIMGAIAARFSTALILLIVDVHFIRSASSIRIRDQFYSAVFVFLSLVPACLSIWEFQGSLQALAGNIGAILLGGVVFVSLYIGSLFLSWLVRGKPDSAERRVSLGALNVLSRTVRTASTSSNQQ